MRNLEFNFFKFRFLKGNEGEKGNLGEKGKFGWTPFLEISKGNGFFDRNFGGSEE